MKGRIKRPTKKEGWKNKSYLEWMSWKKCVV